MNYKCYFCHTRTVEKLIDKFQPDTSVATDLLVGFNELLSEFREMTNPHLVTNLHRMVKSKMDIVDLYASEKTSANNLLLSGYDYWKNKVDKNQMPLYMAIKLAIIGNIIDYGAHSVPEDINEHVRVLIDSKIDASAIADLIIAIKKAKSVLYLGDNAGEIVFDRLFIETLEHPDLTYVVRSKPVINDVTMEDAVQTGIHKVCNVIENGFDAPSTLLDYCSKEFLEAYKHADLIISKGQGNFEGLMDERDKDIYFLLMAKCEPIAKKLGVNKGDLVIKPLNQLGSVV
jgi:hypothetical protein